MKQACLAAGIALGALSLGEDSRVATAVDMAQGEIARGVVQASMIVIRNEGPALGFDATRAAIAGTAPR